MSMPQIMPITSYRLIRYITKESVLTPQPTCPDYGLVGDKLMFHSFKLSLWKNKNFIKENLWRCICEWLEFAGMLFLNVSCGQANNILKAIMQQILSKMHQQLRSLAMPTSYAAIYSWCVVGVFDDLTRSSWPSIKFGVSSQWLLFGWILKLTRVPNLTKH